MTFGWLVKFVGLAAVYAGIVTFAVLTIARKGRWIENWRSAPLLLTTLFFIFLTQHPFPAPAHLECPVPSAEPQLRLLRFWDTVITLYQNGTGMTGWLGNKTIIATVMNFLVCVAIGAALTRHATMIWIAVAFGTALTLLVELTQLTAFWGLYPCAYRQFNVDDLLLNALGTVTGFVAIRALRKRNIS